MATTNVVASLLNNGVRGFDGPHGAHGGSGGYGGGRGGGGMRGTDGGNGTSSGAIDVFLATDGVNNILVDYTLGPTVIHQEIRKGVEPLQLGNPHTHLYLSSRGGDGGYGGRGGDGGDGGSGYAGMNATRNSSGTNGGPGGNGGDGGNGGTGGSSGSGNDIIIRNNQEDMDLLMILKQGVSDTGPGIPGKGGDKGDGGRGGPGGPGGMSYSWTESYQVSDGRGGSTTQYRHYTNPGGISGPSGIKGACGTDGVDGISGTQGIYSILLNTHKNGVVRYEAPYDLHVEKIGYIDTVGYNIIEPDSHVRLSVDHLNVGGMPTPSHQAIVAYVADNGWVECPVENRISMQRWIVEKTCVSIPREIIFHIRDYRHDIRMLPRNPFVQTSTMDHECLVERVNQRFARVAATKSPFTIEYPVQSSMIKGLDCVTMTDEAPFVYSIWNKSLLSIGENSNQFDSKSPNRVLFTTIRVNLNTRGGNTSINPSTDIIVRDMNGRIFNNPENGLYSIIELINPQQLKFASLTLAFINPDTKPYTRVLIESSLYLGHIKDMMNAQPIQSRPLEIQLAEGYISSMFNCDILLVVNNQSEYDEITQWRLLASQLGLTINVWNSALYQGFILNHRKVDGRTLLQDFRSKTIVYLDNNFVKDEMLYPASEYIRSKEFLNAAYHHGIHVLMVGKNFSIEKEIFPINTFERATLVYYKKYKQFLYALKHKIPSGAGCGQIIPPDMAVEDNGDISLNVLVDKKHEYFIVVFRQLTLLSIFKESNSLYPLKTIHLDNFTLTSFEFSENQQSKNISFTLKIQHLDFEINFSPSKDKKLKEISISKIQQLYEILQQIKTISPINNSNTNQLINENINLGGLNVSGGGGERKSVGPISTIIEDNDNIYGGYLNVKFKSDGSYNKLYFQLLMDVKVLYQCEVNKEGKRIGKPKKILNLKRFSLTRGNQFGTEKQNHLQTFQLVTPETTWFFKTKSNDDYQDWLSRLSPMSTEYNLTYTEPSSTVKDQIILKKEDARGIHLSPRSPITEEKHIPIIQVVDRFVVGKPNEKDLIKYAEKLSNKLKSRFPNQRNIVVYEFKPKETNGWKRMTLGNIEVHRSVDKIQPHFAKLNIEQDVFIHSPTMIQTPSTIYHLFKVLDFRAKLSLLDNLAENLPIESEELSNISTQSKLGLLMLSICSDLTEEQHWFREGSFWRDKLSIDKIKLNLLKLNILKNYSFNSYNNSDVVNDVSTRITLPISNILIEIGVHFKIILSNFKRNFADKICLRRRSNDVTNASNSLWNDIIMVHLFNKQLKDDKPNSKSIRNQSELMKSIKEIELKKEKEWKEYLFTQHGSTGSWGYNCIKADPAKKKKEKRSIKSDHVILAYRKPPFSSVTSVLDCEITLPDLMSKQSFLSNYIPPIGTNPIVEERTIFADNQEARQQYINRLATEKLGFNINNSNTSSHLTISENYSSILNDLSLHPVCQLEKTTDSISQNLPNSNSIEAASDNVIHQPKSIFQLPPSPSENSHIIGDLNIDNYGSVEQQQDPSMVIPLSSSSKNAFSSNNQQVSEPSSPVIVDEASKHQYQNNIQQSEVNNNEIKLEKFESLSQKDNISQSSSPTPSSTTPSSSTISSPSLHPTNSVNEQNIEISLITATTITPVIEEPSPLTTPSSLSLSISSPFLPIESNNNNTTEEYMNENTL
ncbi:hypothetical protein RB653_010307 [Dictyostelium firmibasis]|uniref:PH domain-containing protein n=1 Tax=Dictyostelium firmibasis TaxID=79012 RepID=A0AAN7TSN1_9MYCE